MQSDLSAGYKIQSDCLYLCDKTHRWFLFIHKMHSIVLHARRHHMCIYRCTNTAYIHPSKQSVVVDPSQVS